MMKYIYKRKKKIIALIAVILLLILIGLYFFPVYRLSELSNSSAGISFYTKDEIKKCLYIGSAEDRREAKKVLKVAEAAFTDMKHTEEESEEIYGALSGYVPPKDTNLASVEYTLVLWSAHLDETEGYIWVYQSSQGYDKKGNLVFGSEKIPALWKVVKKQGKWIVTNVKEHP